MAVFILPAQTLPLYLGQTVTMKKVVILGFGGTIAMVPNKDGFLASAKSVDELLAYVPRLSDLAEVKVIQVENLDSTNVNPTHWSKLGEEIYALYDECDAIIVTHGTDTMAYTASAVALALGRGLRIESGRPSRRVPSRPAT